MVRIQNRGLHSIEKQDLVANEANLLYNLLHM